MSTDQPSLGEAFAHAAERGRERALATLEGEGAAYDGRDHGGSPDAERGPQNRCECGASVSRDVARVLGDNRGVVSGCRECWRTPHGERYRTDAVAARMAANGEGHRDPEADVDES